MNNVEKFWSYLGFSNTTMDEIQILQLIILLCKEEKVSLPKIDEEITLFNYIVDTFIHKLETNSFKHITEDNIIKELT